MDYDKDPIILATKMFYILLGIWICVFTIAILIGFIFIPKSSEGHHIDILETNYTGLNDPNLIEDIQDASAMLQDTIDRLETQSEDNSDTGCFLSALLL